MDADKLAAVERAIAARPVGEFHFPALYGSDWGTLHVGDRVKLGREFMELVRKGHFPQVEDTGTKKKGGRLYVKAVGR